VEPGVDSRARCVVGPRCSAARRREVPPNVWGVEGNASARKARACLHRAGGAPPSGEESIPSSPLVREPSPDKATPVFGLDVQHGGLGAYAIETHRRSPLTAHEEPLRPPSPAATQEVPAVRALTGRDRGEIVSHRKSVGLQSLCGNQCDGPGEAL